MTTSVLVGRLGGPRGAIATIAATLAALALAVFVSTKAADISPLAPLAVALFLVVPAWLFVNERVEISLAVLILYLGLLDGFIKLSVTTELASVGRDVLLYAIVLGMLTRTVVQHRATQIPPLMGWVLAWTLVVLAQLFNPNNGSWLHSLASLRQHLEFVPLFFVGFLVMRNMGRLRVFVVLLVVVAAANGVVGLVQSTLSPDQLASWGPGYAAIVEGKGGAPRTFAGDDGEAHVRPPALGSDAGFGGVIGAIALPGSLALLLTRRRGGRIMLMRAALGAATAMAVVAVLTSQARSAVVIAVAAVLAFVALAAASRQAGRLIGGILAAGVLTFVGVTVATGQDTGAGFRYDSIAPDKVLETTVQSRSGTFNEIPKYVNLFPFGAGIGSTGPVAALFGGAKVQNLDSESQYTFMLVELGVPGLLMLIAFFVRLLTGVVRRLRRLRDKELQLLLAALAAPLFAQVVNWTVGSTTATSPTAPYLWFVAGIFSYWLWAGGARGHESADTVEP